MPPRLRALETHPPTRVQIRPPSTVFQVAPDSVLITTVPGVPTSTTVILPVPSGPFTTIQLRPPSPERIKELPSTTAHLSSLDPATTLPFAALQCFPSVDCCNCPDSETRHCVSTETAPGANATIPALAFPALTSTACPSGRAGVASAAYCALNAGASL